MSDDLPDSLMEAARKIRAGFESAEVIEGEPVSPDEEPGTEESLPPVAPDALADPLLVACAAEPQNDTGNSRRFRRRYGDLAPHGPEVTHVQAIGWFVWDDKRWKEDIDQQGVRPLAHKTAELIAAESLLIRANEVETIVLNQGAEAQMEIEPIEAEIAELEALDPDESSTADKARIKKLKHKHAALTRLVRAAERIEKRIQARKTDRRRHGNSSGNTGKLDGMLNEALSYLSRPVADFDQEELGFNCENGTLFVRQVMVNDPDWWEEDLNALKPRTKIGIREHRREDYNSKISGVAYDPDAQCPIFDAFLARILPDETVRCYLQRFFGYCLTRRTSEQMFCIFHGGGKNGKSTLVDIMGKIMAEYSVKVPVASLMADNARKAQDATPDLNGLPGARFVRASEPKEGIALNEALVKDLTGGEPIMLRRLNKEAVSIYPEFKLVISTNHRPRILGNDTGIWRRIAMVPFDVQITADEIDKALPHKLWGERSGILNWMLAGLIDYLALGGLDPPKAVLDATEDYRLAEDPTGKFAVAALQITRDPNDRIESGRLYEGFVAWAKRSGEPVLSSAVFQRRMPKTAEQHGFVKGKASVSIYEGIVFRPGFAPVDTPSHTRFDD
jgi:putative DNA primase/helicase